MNDILNMLCSIDAPSGNEDKLREFIISQIHDFATYNVDKKGNLIVYKKGVNKSTKKILIDAHMDEVGIIVTCPTSDGFLKFKALGGIEPSVLLGSKVRFENGAIGLIGVKPVHLLNNSEKDTLPKIEDMYIDVGSCNDLTRSIGLTGVIIGDFYSNDDYIMSKALDDRVGVYTLIKLIQSNVKYDFYGVFSTGEEIGSANAACAALGVNPDFALILEGTTAGDLHDVSTENEVCVLGEGPVISFMDGGTLYDKHLTEVLINSGIKNQLKRKVAGGNNAAYIHKSGDGIPCCVISVGCRYIHSPSNVCSKSDLESAYKLAEYFIEYAGKNL